MPKPARKPEVVREIRDRILEQAIDIISDYGFDGFSMRRLAARQGIAAKTLYNYFTNKDEIYLLVLTKGFELLNQVHMEAYESEKDPYSRLKAMNRAYIEFGLSHAHYYNIMFNWDVPKYSDYVGTRLEPVAYAEKKEALKVAETSFKAIKEMVESTGRAPKSFNELQLLLAKGWASLHGIVSLINSRVFQETLDEETTSQFMKALENGTTIDRKSKPRSVEQIIEDSIEGILEDLFKDFL